MPDANGSNKPAPSDVDAERAVIGAVLIRQEIPPELTELGIDDFFLPGHRNIWEVAKDMHDVGVPIDLTTLGARLRDAGMIGSLPDGESYLMTCASAVPTSVNAAHYGRIVMDKSLQRRVIAACALIASSAYSSSVHRDALLSLMREQVSMLEHVGQGAGPVRVGDEIEAVIDAVKTRAEDPDKFFTPTGLAKFDRSYGGLRPGKLIVVAGPPGLGKSAWAGTVACNCAMKNVPALIISLEMARDELIERFLAGEARIPNQDISSGRIAQPDPVTGATTAEWRSVCAAGLRFGSVPLWIDDTESMTISQVVGTIRRWYAQHIGSVPPADRPPNRAFIAVDYLQLIASDDDESNMNRALEVGRWTRALKMLSKSLRVPIALLSQLNRQWANRGSKPRLSDLRDSGSIEQDADMVVFPWREPTRDQETGEAVVDSASGPADLIVGKNRGGATGTIRVMWHAEYTRFDNLEEGFE